jgi:hypothetical protein
MIKLLSAVGLPGICVEAQKYPTWNRSAARLLPSTPAERIKLTVIDIASEPGLMVPYALGAIEIERMRAELERSRRIGSI